MTVFAIKGLYNIPIVLIYNGHSYYHEEFVYPDTVLL